MKKQTSIHLLVATWFKTGLIPPVFLKSMAGTYGSFFALPLCWLLITFSRYNSDPGWIYFQDYLMVFFAGLLTVEIAEKELGPRIDHKNRTKTQDQPQIVIDEVFGMLISCIPLLFVPEVFWWHYGIAFGLFRFFDITKIWPAKIFDRMHNAFGVMMDDFVAGVYSAVILQALIARVL